MYNLTLLNNFESPLEAVYGTNDAATEIHFEQSPGQTTPTSALHKNLGNATVNVPGAGDITLEDLGDQNSTPYTWGVKLARGGQWQEWGYEGQGALTITVDSAGNATATGYGQTLQLPNPDATSIEIVNATDGDNINYVVKDSTNTQIASGTLGNLTSTKHAPQAQVTVSSSNAPFKVILSPFGTPASTIEFDNVEPAGQVTLGILIE